MNPRHFVAILCLLSLQPAISQVAAQVPKAAAAREATEPFEDSPVVVGNLEHKGFALWGPHGRHYFFGGLAVADYVSHGQRQIVTLQQEEPTLLPKPDENFLYYRELQSGHRWAIGRHALADGTYVLYYQPHKEAGAVATTPKRAWQEFQRARLQRSKEVAPQPVKTTKPVTAHHW
jgi:hypothetical protein